MERNFIGGPRPIAQDPIVPVGVVAQRIFRELTVSEIENRMGQADKAVGGQHCGGADCEREDLGG
jgi:hypothetical protein